MDIGMEVLDQQLGVGGETSVSFLCCSFSRASAASPKEWC